MIVCSFDGLEFYKGYLGANDLSLKDIKYRVAISLGLKPNQIRVRYVNITHTTKD